MTRKVFLILLALVLAISVGLVACGGAGQEEEEEEEFEPVTYYELTMAASPAAGGTVAPVGIGLYEANHLVNIQATINSAYRFVGWEAPAGTFDDATALTTSFKMPAQPVTVTARFQGQPGLPPYNYLNCYLATDFHAHVGDWSGDVVLDDQFNAFDVLMGEPCCFCDPVSVAYEGAGGGGLGGGWTTVISSPDHHLTTYTLEILGPLETWSVMVENQFGMQQLTVEGPYMLAVPTQKLEPQPHEPPVGLDHFLIYSVMEGPDVNVVVDLGDEFGPHLDAVIARPTYFGNPVHKKHYGTELSEYSIENPAAHLVFYSLQVEDWSPKLVECVDQFGWYYFTLETPWLLAVPSWKSYAHSVP